MKKGLTFGSKIFLLLVLIVVGFSSYTIYNYYTKPDFDFYGMREVTRDVVDVVQEEFVAEEEFVPEEEEVFVEEKPVEKSTMEAAKALTKVNKEVRDNMNEMLEGEDLTELDDFEIEIPYDTTVATSDAERVAKMHIIKSLLDVYKSTNGNYPERSACVGKLDELIQFLPNVETILENMEPALFVSEDESTMKMCMHGYYYQYFGGDEYILWTKVEDKSSGNHDYFIIDKGDWSERDEGYYLGVVNIENGPGMMVE